MRVAIVGGSGFVGGHVADKLMKAGHDVLIVDANDPRWHPTQMYSKASILDYERLVEVLSGSQVVMHLAAMSNTQMAINDPQMCTRLNCEGTVNVLEAARSIGAERVVVASSTLISGQQPLEPDGKVTNDDLLDLMKADHPYVVSKTYAEMMARVYTAQYGLPHTVFRYGIQYGERMTPGVVVHTFIERALQGKRLIVHGTGEQWRQYVYVGDIADAHVTILDRWEDSENQTFPLVGEEKVTIRQLARAVTKVVHGEIEKGKERPGDIEVQYVSPEFTARQLGWKAETSLDEGVAKTVAWYKKHLSSGIRRR
jgi:UDP-glucose 4-epimerase